MVRLLIPLLILARSATLVASPQSAAIAMDGHFDEWGPQLATLVDDNSPASGIDLLSMQVTNDAQYLYIKLSLDSEIDLLDDLVPQTIRLYVDGDNNATTGTPVQTGYGAELQIRFDTRTVTEYIGTTSNVSWNTLDLVSLPSTTSAQFEVAIARNAKPDGVNDLFTSSSIKLLFRESDGGDAMPNAGSTFTYTFDATPLPPLVPMEVARVNASDVRIVCWNVLSDGITNPALQSQFQRMLTAMAPDIIGFSECVTSTAAQVKARLDGWLPIGGSGWQVVKDDYDMVTASRWPITQTWPELTRQFAALIDLPPSYATDLLFTSAHLNCCAADAIRQNQCDEYVQFVQDAKSPGGIITLQFNTPMVYGGDLNSVGHAQQLITLLTGDIINNATYGPDGDMDWDGTAQSSTHALQTHARMAYSWRNNNSSYPSGLLDHMLYTDAAAMLSKSFLLRTAIMPAPVLASLGLQAGDAAATSDHFPVVGDFAVPQAALRLSARAFLEGAFVPGAGLMHDSLRMKGLLPLTEPNTAAGFVTSDPGASATPAVLAVAGPNAIVDWAVLELRDANAPAIVVMARNVLVQRDGDFVAPDGSSPVLFSTPADDYLVAVRHRNHLGAMIAVPIALSYLTTSVDFTTDATATYGTEATKSINATRALWAGNVLPDGQIRYLGESNDRDPVLVRIGGNSPNATTTGYHLEDVNLDGTVRYVGANNDRDPILVNIGGSAPFNIRMEQLP